MVTGKGLRQRRGSAEGGEASLPNYAEDFYTIIQHALLPLNEVRRIDVRSTAADPDSFVFVCVKHMVINV